LRERLDPREFCPAAGQGALGIETRADDESTIASLAFLNDSDTLFAVTAERAALAALGGGCQVPIGVHCGRASSEDAERSAHEIFAVVADPDSGEAVRVYHREATNELSAEALGQLAARMLLEAGAGPLLALSGEAVR
jgi:hydroxymethylbilane synthase